MPGVLHTHAHTLGHKIRLAIALAMVGGFVDAVGFLILKNFVSNMTGNTAVLAARVVDGHARNALYVYFLIVMFTLGAFLSGLITEGGRRQGYKSVYSMALALEAGFLALFLILRETVDGYFYLVSALPCLAMGLQNATITQIAGSVVRTTHVTGVVTDLGLEGAQYLYWLRDRTRGRLLTRLRRSFRLSPRHPSLQRLLLLASIWSSFLIGAALGALLKTHWGEIALGVPVLFLLLTVSFDILRPRARIEALDHSVDDRELQSFGIPAGLLPASVQIFRVCPRGRFGRGAPDLSQLHRKLARRTRVLLLMIPSDVDVSSNSLLGLQTSIEQLRTRRCQLIVCAASPDLHHDIRQGEIGRILGDANLLPDPEFAVARAMEITDAGFSLGGTRDDGV